MGKVSDSERAQQIVPAGQLAAVGFDAMLGEQIDYVGRQGPAELKETADLGRGVVGDEHRAGTGVEGGSPKGKQLVAPEPDFTPAKELAADHADRPRALAEGTVKFKIDGPDLAKHCSGSQTPALLHGGVFHVIDGPAAERDAKQFLEWFIRPHRLGEVSLGFKNAVVASTHVGGDLGPRRLGSRRSVSGRLMPSVCAAGVI